MGTFNLSSMSHTIKANHQAIDVPTCIGLLRKINSFLLYRFKKVFRRVSLTDGLRINNERPLSLLILVVRSNK